MCKVVLIRPGATIYDEQNRVQGILDIPLSERGRGEVARMAQQLAGSLNGDSLAAIYCGPGEYVVRSAEIVGKTLGLRPKRVDDFRNLDHGLWQGLQIEEIKRRNTKLFRQWIDDPETICPPQGETLGDARERIKSALKPLLKRHHNETIGLVVGEPLASMIACYLRCAPRVHLEEPGSRCNFECIEIEASFLKNGTH
jgi:broad specificity phosphatase PhoE